MSAPYPYMNGTLVGNNVMNIFVYANQVTSGYFMFFTVIAFFLVVLIASLVMQMRFTARIRPETSFAAACFATLGFAVILEQTTGVLNPIYFFVIVALTIMSVLWLVLSSD